MSYNAKILKDSVTQHGHRLITLEVTYPRIVLAEFNTHRVFSRNSASSRAIPIEKTIKRIEDDPFIPTYWGKNQKGMVATRQIDDELCKKASEEWVKARDFAVETAKNLLNLGVHKQITNRLLEPFMWQTVIVTATEWENFLALRCHPDAQPEIMAIAEMMKNAILHSTPSIVDEDSWHMPLVEDEKQLLEEGYSLEDIKKISVGRCARVSYLTHNGSREPKADIELCERLRESGHMSPFEHVAKPMSNDDLNKQIYLGNFKGWVQYRKELPNEDNFQKTLNHSSSSAV